MANIETPIKKEQTTILTAEDKKRIENHRNIADHLAAAGIWRREVANHQEVGNHDKAAECTVRANWHHCAANELLKQDANHNG
ncbi:MAG TPA: hypothetical protein VF411_10715 [Bacteroidia bacterium]